jgi:dTDP-4-amino-4,6-dideoxygalactose transaminase
MFAKLACLRKNKPRLFNSILVLLRIVFSPFLRIYPFTLNNEILRVAITISSGDWNSTYSSCNEVFTTEERLCSFFDAPNAILVSSGGVALEMLLRLISKPESLVLHHNMTCSAVPFSILRAGRVPYVCQPETDLFHNIFEETTDESSVIVNTHFWGCLSNSRNSKDITAIDDACLSFGSTFNDGYKYNINSKATFFSFGCIKPIQAGEGGLIITHDNHLAKELRIMRDYGNRTRYDCEVSLKSFGLNGRLSNISASIIREQLKGYSSYLKRLRVQINITHELIVKENLPFSVYNIEHGLLEYQSITALILYSPVFTDSVLTKMLRDRGINAFPAFFSPISHEPYFADSLYRIDFPNIKTSKLRDSVYNNSKTTIISNYVCIPRFWISNQFFRQKLISTLTSIARII